MKDIFFVTMGVRKEAGPLTPSPSHSSPLSSEGKEPFRAIRPSFLPAGENPPSSQNGE